MSFYVTLPSDSSLRYFSGNKISHFITQLPSPINLIGEWEVGLSEIIYPHSWYNVNETNNTFFYDIGDGKLVKKSLEVGYYESPYDIITTIHSLIPKTSTKYTLNYNKNSKRIKAHASQGASLHLQKLSTLLGFRSNTIIRGSMKSELAADVMSDFSFFYVYTDIVSPQIVGDVYAPLLRIVQVKGLDGEVISQYFERPQYLPVTQQSFHTINIEIRLNSGGYVPFEKGKVIVVLHFRMRQII